MSAEVIGFSSMFHCDYSLGLELSELLGKKISIALLTDSNDLFNVITKGSCTSEKRKMINMSVASEADISDMGHVSRTKNIANGLTKSMN